MDGIAQDYSNSSALPTELQQYCANPSILATGFLWIGLTKTNIISPELSYDI